MPGPHCSERLRRRRPPESDKERRRSRRPPDGKAYPEWKSTSMTSIAALSAADRATFVAAIVFAFEHSPWIAEAAWQRRPFADLDDLLTALNDVVAQAPEARRIALIAAHPDLAGRVARDGRLTAASLGEQAAAGLDRLTSD